ncbi:hypothetical protein B0H12DRAFT_116962 [Mycena haematopus]|nr:hypothetical protein B0H12DRAFT_116962 [Mycena haematopus]
MLRCMQVSSLLLAIQEQHRSDCENGGCGQCTGPIFAKSAWLLQKYPDGTTYDRSSRLKHDPPNGIEFMVSASYIREYLGVSPPRDLIVLCESTCGRTAQPSLSRVPSTRKRLSDTVSDGSGKKAKLDPPPHQGLTKACT